MVKVWGTRHSLIGDTIMSLPILSYLKYRYSDCYINFSIAKKCAQSAPLYFNHPLIDRIKITDERDTYSKKDLDIISSCDIVFNCTPQHEQNDWYNYYNCVEETWRMAGLDLKLFNALSFHNRFPTLYRWWDKKEFDGFNIAIWPFAAYGGGDQSRNPSVEQWKEIIKGLVRNFNAKIHHFGWYTEPILSVKNYCMHTKKSFVEQIQSSLDCQLILGTDSGSMWATGAYHEVPQINLLSNRVQDGHVKNKLAMAPQGRMCSQFLVEDSWKNLNIKSLMEVIEKQYDKSISG